MSCHYCVENGAEPTISLVDYKGQGIGLTCSSQGWYPEPKVFWLAGGEDLTKMSDTRNTKTPTGNFSVFSSLTLEPGVSGEVACKIVNNVLQMDSESRILITGEYGWGEGRERMLCIICFSAVAADNQISMMWN